MTSAQPKGTTRRYAIKLGIGGLAALGAAQVARAQTPAVSSGGLAGGGLAQMDRGEANFAIFGTRLAIPGQEEEQIFGRVQWVDAAWEGAGLTLETTEVTDYGPMPDVENGREMRGRMSMNGSGSYPFVLRAVDAGPPGSGEDTIELLVGAAAEEGTPEAGAFTYVAEATLTAGDLQLLDFTIADEA